MNIEPRKILNIDATQRWYNPNIDNSTGRKLKKVMSNREFPPDEVTPNQATVKNASPANSSDAARMNDHFSKGGL